ncbi:MAG TPA: GntR family transcriptional regulator [Clostridiales bacterium]|nr:GntR family transcriptional regulator [Clostridiales bacterium]
MRIDFNSIKPLYMQIAEGIEDDIIKGVLKEGDQSYSQLTISKELNVNPATAAKGINVLVHKGILEKQRGLSMIVAAGAREKLLEEKKENIIYTLAQELIEEAQKVGMNQEAVIKLIHKIYDKGGNKENE